MKVKLLENVRITKVESPKLMRSLPVFHTLKILKDAKRIALSLQHAHTPFLKHVYGGILLSKQVSEQYGALKRC